LTFARSVDPVTPLDLTITRVAVTRTGEDKETEMGRKALLPYGLYRGYGFFNPSLAKQTGFREEDLAVFWEALQGMWDLDRSASRGLMGCQGLVVFSHDCALGNAPAHRLFDLVKVQRREGVTTTRHFSDYEVLLYEAQLPAGVTASVLVAW
jgi:CRISPR-associated protein Csd2